MEGSLFRWIHQNAFRSCQFQGFADDVVDRLQHTSTPLCIPPHEKQVYVFVDINEDVLSGSKNTTLLLVAASRFVFLHVPYLVSIVSIIFVARHLEIWHWTFSSPLSPSSFFDDYKQFQNGISWIWYTLPLE